ncbi:MAG: hypothetical protein ACTSP4_15115 [Candidatus Hodarchaeales archaeon]
MLYPFFCTAMVKGILDAWPKINSSNEVIKNWRGLKAKKIIPISKPIADAFFETFKDSKEARVIKDNYYYTWGTIGIEIEGRNIWYFPYLIIHLNAFGLGFEDVVSELSRTDDFIDISKLVDTIDRLNSSISVNFRKREIEFLKTLITEKNDLIHGILTYEEIGQILGISHGQARNYWKNLDKFFKMSIYINYSKLGLFPVLVKHNHELSDLEKKYTRFSFYDNGNYYSTVLIPYYSSWIEENQSDPRFQLLGTIKKVDFDWNLTHFTEKAQDRWGTYPGIQRKSIRRTSSLTVVFDPDKRIDGFHRKDFEILQLTSKTIGRARTAASYLDISESYYCQRMAFLAEKSVFITLKSLFLCGLDVNMFLVLYTEKDNEKGKDVLKKVSKGLVYLPGTAIYSGDNCMIAIIRIPSRWLHQYMLEFSNLTEPGGLWCENGIKAVTHNCRTRSSIVNPMINLKDLVILQKDHPGKLSLDWTFEIPRTKLSQH